MSRKENCSLDKAAIIISDTQSAAKGLSFALSSLYAVDVKAVYVIKTGGAAKSEKVLKKNIQRHLQDDSGLVIVLCLHEATLGYWIWHVIRSKYGNPIVVLDVLDNIVMVQQHPAFKATKTSKSHCYTQIPFIIKQLAVNIQAAQPYQGDLGKLWRDFSTELGYIQFRVHVLKGPGSGISFAETRERLQEALEYFERMQNITLVKGIKKWFAEYVEPLRGWAGDANGLRENIEAVEREYHENNTMY